MTDQPILLALACFLAAYLLLHAALRRTVEATRQQDQEDAARASRRAA